MSKMDSTNRMMLICTYEVVLKSGVFYFLRRSQYLMGSSRSRVKP